MSTNPSQGEVWQVNFGKKAAGEVKGHEEAGERPALIVSVNELNHGPAGLIVVVPISSKEKRVPTHVTVAPPEGGLTVTSFIKCEAVRSISKERLLHRRGTVSDETLGKVHELLRMVFGL